MRLNAPQKICLGFLFFLLIYWMALFIHGSTTGFSNYLYSFLFGLVPLVGGVAAMIRVRAWGGLKNAVGKAVFFIGLGIFFWGSGEIIWSYYNFFLGVPAPYPSLADIGFAPSIFFYGLGAVYLARATGVHLTLRGNRSAKIFAVSASAAVLPISYYVLVVIARGGRLVTPGETPLKVILDIAYPFGDFLGLAISVVVSGLAFRYLRSTYKRDIIAILSGLGVMFVADAIFSYTTTTNTYYNGNIGDLVLTIGLFLLTFGVLGFFTPREGQPLSSEMDVYGDRVVFTSGTEDFALVVENRELAEALRKTFVASEPEKEV